MSRRRLAAELLRGADWFNDALLDGLEAAGWPRLTRNQAQVFPLLAPDGVSQSEIARRLGITRQSVNVLVSEMVDAEILAKTPDPADARLTRIVLTETGRRLASDAGRILADLEATLAQRLGNEQFDGLRNGLLADWGPSPVDELATRHARTLP